MLRLAVIAGVVGIVVANWDGGGTRQTLKQATDAGEQIQSASRFCGSRPELCASLASSAAESVKQEAIRRLQNHTGTVQPPSADAPKTAFPANPPPPRRRPAGLD